MRGLNDFEGAWLFRRRITDPAGAETARAEGTLTFAPGEGGLVAEERGTLSLPGAAPMQAERRTIWRAGDDVIETFFADGRPFHRIDLGADVSTDRHLCSPDLYDVAYDFRAFPFWTALWRVTGPRKDYVMRSAHLPAGDGITWDVAWAAVSGQVSGKLTEDWEWLIR